MFKNDSVRYKRKGYGLLVATITALAFFFVFPHVLNDAYPTLLGSNDPVWFVFFTSTGLHMFMNIFCYVFSYFLYTAKSPFLERYKVSDAPWPWQENQKEWKTLLKKSIALFLFNNLVVAPLMMFASLALEGISQRTSTTLLPSCKDIILQLSFCMIVEDFCFYWGHRLLHSQFLYPYVHKIHHQYNQTVSIANEYAHPLEFLMSNLIPSSLGPKLLGKQMHLVTFWMWIILRVGESVDGHCGYDFSWSPFRLLPLSGSSTYHDFHHSANVGNYCSLFTFWDTVFHTNRDYWVWLSKSQKDSQLAEIKNAYKSIKSTLLKDSDGQKKETDAQTVGNSGHKKTE
jgi:methylsterol monooxygenase/4-alpha-methyl-delta7-sterol-4alpha-methyl oxidase